MRKLALLFVGLLVAVLLFAGDWVYTELAWNTGEVSVTGLIDAEVDTSDVFALAKQGEYQNWEAPETLSFLFWATENSIGSDSTNVVFSLQLSNDLVYWHDYGTLTTITNTTADTGATTIDDIIKTDFALFKWGRVHIESASGAGDTVSVGGGLTLDYSN